MRPQSAIQKPGKNLIIFMKNVGEIQFLLVLTEIATVSKL